MGLSERRVRSKSSTQIELLALQNEEKGELGAKTKAQLRNDRDPVKDFWRGAHKTKETMISC